jgi:EpsI family protein
MGWIACWRPALMTREALVALVTDRSNNGGANKVPMAIIVAAALLLGGLAASEWLQPRRVMADEMAPINLPEVIPKAFGDWRVVEGGSAVVTDPTVEAAVKLVYSQTLGRTYVNSKREIIMLSLAYGKNQNSWNTAAHRPEFCYRAQGFEVVERGVVPLNFADHSVPTKHLAATRQGVLEPITYWVTLHDTAALPGFSRRLQQMKFGLQGMIVDGFLFRISSVGGTEDAQFERHVRFAHDLEQAMPVPYRSRFFGSKQ